MKMKQENHDEISKNKDIPTIKIILLNNKNMHRIYKKIYIYYICNYIMLIIILINIKIYIN